MQNFQKTVQELCQLSVGVVSNPTQSLSCTAKKLGLSTEVIKAVEGKTFLIQSLFYGPFIGSVLHIWRKYTELQKQGEKERMLQEIITKQQAVIRRLAAEEAKMKHENAKNRIEIENLKKMISILEQVRNQFEKYA